MIAKFFKRGNRTADNKFSTGGKAAQDYLLNERVENGTARLLKGDPDETTEIINGLKFSTIYTSGCLSFDEIESQKIDDQMKEKIIDGFERALFGDFDLSRTSGYWVEHTDKKRLELNFVFANVDLETGKNLPVYYHAIDKNRVNDYKDLINLKYGLSDPNDPSRRHTTQIANNLPKDKKQLKQAINDYLTTLVADDQLADHTAVKNALTDLGLEITRTTKTAISIKDPAGSNKPIRLTGAYYEQQYQRSNIVNPSENQAITASRSDRMADITSRLEQSIKRRTESLHDRFKPSLRELNKRNQDRPQSANRQINEHNQRPTNANKFTYRAVAPKPTPIYRPVATSKRQANERNHSRAESVATADSKRHQANQLPTAHDNDFNYSSAIWGNRGDGNNNIRNQRLQSSDYNRPDLDSSYVYSSGGSNGNQKQRGRISNEQPHNTANRNEVRSIIQRSNSAFELLFKQCTDRTKSSYERLNRAVAKFTDRQRATNKQLGRAIATATDSNKQLSQCIDTAKQVNRGLEQSDRTISNRIESKHQQRQQQQKAAPQKPTQTQQQPKPQTQQPKRPEQPRPMPGPKRRP